MEEARSISGPSGDELISTESVLVHLIDEEK